ncbi:hypothetical protein [Gordonia phthalatica]|uniref:Uncharacterized protein n=1 Tax=Gordonia phthalatica TaxID=1136941 RepID=A0A0N9NDX2_9ACTN|nr:hypothetical protein [Gordonia phthalatica]ALG83776.1 hypothetical protein ACH46_03695 [Gordonia phthalatica]
MRKSLIAAAGAAVLLVVVLILTLAGAILPSVEGTARPNEATRALSDLNKASTALADAPGAEYDGLITISTTSGSVKVRVTGLTVTAAGDVQGKVQQGSDGQADWLQIGDKTYAKGGDTFWKNHPISKQPKSVTMATPPADQWVSVPESFLGIDLRAALRPARLGLNLSQQDTALGDTDLQGQSVGLIGETPDKRVATGKDPIGVSEIDVEENDGGIEGSRRFQAGSLTVGVNEAGDVVALRGPLGKGYGGDTMKVEADLTVQKLNGDAVRGAYSTIKSSLQGAKIGATDVTIGDPTGDLTCNRGGDCVISYDVSNTSPSLTRGTASVKMDTSFKKGDKEFATCTVTVAVPLNGRSNLTCRTPFGAPADVNSGTRFTVTVNGEIDDAALTAALEQGQKVADSATGWTPTAPKALTAAREYNRQVAVAPSNYVYKVGAYGFDGRERDGTLLLVHGPGYESHVLPDGTMDPAWKGTEELLTQARDARSAAGDKPVRMVFDEPRVADAVRALLIANNIERVEVVAAVL